MNCEKNWIDILSALLTPTIAIAGLYIAFFNYKLGIRKRKDELYDRRYEFYKRLEKRWKSTGVGAGPNENPMGMEWDEIEYWTHEAEFLFGNDIVKHIASLGEKEYDDGADGHLSYLPDSAFSDPFLKYLSFENVSLWQKLLKKIKRMKVAE